MLLVDRTINITIKGITRTLCRVDTRPLLSVPARGPLIMVCNHINFIEVPLMYTHLQPRTVIGYAKSESWDNPILAPLFNIWGAISVRRGEADIIALRKGLQVLNEGHILVITPEGTRSGDGRLRKGHPGVVMLALLSGAPILPVVYWGQESLYRNLRRLKRTDFNVKVGRPFYVKVADQKVNQTIRRAIAEEIMYQLAALLPPAYRGEYADLSQATTCYLQFQS
jgi:1-acyl-sn-glycerol-3-phosphate acyltransferase